MAKKTISAFDIIKKIDDSAMIVAENENAEVKEFTHYDKECFDLEFNYGNFDKDGK